MCLLGSVRLTQSFGLIHNPNHKFYYLQFASDTTRKKLPDLEYCCSWPLALVQKGFHSKRLKQDWNHVMLKSVRPEKFKVRGQKIKSKRDLKKITTKTTILIFELIQYRPGQLDWDFHITYAFIKKSTFFTQWLWNSVKIKYSWVLDFDRVSWSLGKKCRFLIKTYVLWKSKLGCPGL